MFENINFEDGGPPFHANEAVTGKSIDEVITDWFFAESDDYLLAILRDEGVAFGNPDDLLDTHRTMLAMRGKLKDAVARAIDNAANDPHGLDLEAALEQLLVAAGSLVAKDSFAVATGVPFDFTMDDQFTLN